MACVVSNGHLTDDVTGRDLVKFTCKYLKKRLEIDAWYQLPTNRKWPLADQMITSPMT